MNEINLQQIKAAVANHAEGKKLLADGWSFKAHEYTDVNDNLVFVRVRLDPPLGSKEQKWIRSLSFDGQKWHFKEPKFNATGKPLYRLPNITSNPDATIWITEGEACADALMALGLVATTSGSCGSAETADWNPVAGRRVIIWRDNDDPGLGYAQKVTQRLLSIGRSVQWVNIAKLGLEEKDDCINWLKNNPLAKKSDIESLPFIDPEISQALQRQDIDAPAYVLEEAILQLSKLSEIKYEQIRIAEAKRMNLRVVFLDNLVKRAREQSANATKSDELTCGIEPWPEAVCGREIAESIKDFIKRHIVLSDYQATVLTLWIFGSYCFDAFNVFPKLLITSPEKRCGKSMMMSVLNYFCDRSVLASSITPAGIFRIVDLWRPTLLIDEADTFLKGYEELRGIINSGHRRDTAYIIRVEGDGNNRMPRQFSTWSPMAIAMIKNPPDTILDRSVIIKLRRKMPSEKIERLGTDVFENVKTTRQKLKRWAIDNISTLKNTVPEIPKSGNDRAIDNWGPLFAIARLLDSKWLQCIRDAFLSLNEIENEECLTSMLLEDIKSIFQETGVDKIHSGFLVSKLIRLEDRPWCEYRNGDSMRTSDLSQLLKPFGIKAKQIWSGHQNRNGYEVVTFKDVFARYIPSVPNQNSRSLGVNADGCCSDILNSREISNLEFQDPTGANIGVGSRALEFATGGKEDDN